MVAAAMVSGRGGDLRRDGFVVVEGPIASAAALDDVRARLDCLHARAGELGRRHFSDLGPVQHHLGPADISEVTWARELDPDLEDNPVVTALAHLAADLLGSRVWCAFDHSIYKPPGCQHDVAWHQDAAFAGGPVPASVHLWLALDDVDEGTGGLRYARGSHGAGLLPHRPAHPGGLGHQLLADVDHVDVASPSLRAGGVVGHDPYTLHSSGPSASPVARRSWTLQFRRGRGRSLTERARLALRRSADRP